jgi:hypothetical protein
MKYWGPINSPGGINGNDGYINGNPATGTEGSIPTFQSFEQTLRELQNFVIDSGKTPSAVLDGHQISQSVQSGKVIYAVDTGTTNALTVDLTPPPDAINVGMTVRVKLAHGITGPAVLTVHPFPTAPIKKNLNVDLENGDYVSGQILTFSFDGTNWQCATVPVTLGGSGGGPPPVDGSGFTTNAVGAFINKFRNATCVVAGRGTNAINITAGAGPSYTLDGHVVLAGGSGTIAVQQVAQAPGTRAPAGLQISGAAGITDVRYYHLFESIDISVLANRQCTLQFKVRNLSGASITPTLTMKYPGSRDGWGTSTAFVTNLALQPCPDATTTQVSWNGTLDPNVVNGLSLSIDFGAGLNGSKIVQLFDFDIREMVPGILPIPELRPFFIEQLQCQRFLPKVQPQTNSAITCGAMQNSAEADVPVVYGTLARVPPTGLTVNNAANWSMTHNGANYNCTSVLWNNGGVYGANVTMAYFTAGLWAIDSATQINSQAANALLMFTGCELMGGAI